MNRLELYVAQHNPEMDDDVVKAMRKRRAIERNIAVKDQREFFCAPWRMFLVKNWKAPQNRDRLRSLFKVSMANARFSSKNFLYEMSRFNRSRLT